MSKPAKSRRLEPEIPHYEDAHGKEDGVTFSPYAQEAKYAVAVQRVASVGRRPADWLKRELLVGSAGGDRRNWAYRKVLANESSFLLQGNDHVSSKDNQEKVVREARAFDYLSRHHLLTMLDTTERGTPEFRAAALASVCYTSLYEANQGIPHDWTFGRNRNVCCNASVCPHCYARLAAEQFEKAQQCLKKSQPAALALLSDSYVVALSEAVESRRQMSKMRRALKAVAAEMGGTGGLWAYQVGPVLDQTVRWDTNEAIYEDVPVLLLRVALLAEVPRTKSSLERLTTFDHKLDKRQVLSPEAQIDVLPYDAKRTLRAVMVGSRNTSTALQQLENNHHGLFHWPSVWLCSAEQWHSRFSMNRSRKAVCKWGDWAAVASNTSTRSSTTSKVHGTQSVEKRRELLFYAALPVLLEYGEPENPLPGRRRLHRLLADKGIHASERDVRWLIDHHI